MKRVLPIIILAVLLFAQPRSAHADGPSCNFQPDGSIECHTGGGGGGGGNGGGGGETCNPNDVHYGYRIMPAGNTCQVVVGYFDCYGQLVSGGEVVASGFACPVGSPPPQNPCDQFSISGGGVTCGVFDWDVKARVTFPQIYLDVRPYPATLVRWPTAVRNGGLPSSSGSGTKDYIPYGGGSSGDPHEGDWQNLRLTLTLRAAGPMFVSLPHIGDLALPDRGAGGNPTVIQWQVPSHPAVGAGPLAGTISGLEELPRDIPLFVGKGHAPYKLYWDLHYQEYTAIKDCVPGPTGGGKYNCGGGTGHKEVVGYEWRGQSQGGEIPPEAVQNLPASVMADINGDGTPDAYWDNNLTLRRMDDSNRINDPRYARSWNWGGIIYWAVREGQGQIGWPGQ